MKKNLILIIIIIISNFAYSQSKQDLKKIFVNAEFALLYKEYQEALPLFLQLHNAGKKDANIKQRIGLCYLNIPNEKNKSIPYLEEAVKDISKNYEVGYYTEKKAPIITYYYLGIAYRIDNQLNKAIKAFNKYKSLLEEKDTENLKNVNTQITSCTNAIELSKTPTNLLETNLGKFINTAFANNNAVVSEDETIIIFMNSLRFYDGIFSSKKKNGKWLPARNISLQFKSNRPLRPVFLTRDGKTLYLQRNDNDDFNIYISKFEMGSWSQVKKIGSNINSKSTETHACVSDDGKILYFTSDREGGIGGLDIYKSYLDEDNEWGPAINLGPTINTIFDEESPFITENGNSLYFSSQGHLNIGYPFNSTDDDIFFFPLKNGKTAYYSKLKPTGYGENDIYKIKIFERVNILKEK
jgi:hypothetical protein